MKKIIMLLLLIFPSFLFAQFGIKAGLNFSNVSNASSVNNSTRSGFHAGILFAPGGKAILGSRTELLYSRQGYNYSSGSANGSVKLDYLMLSQLMAINITRFVQLQLGAQTSYLLTAAADSNKQSTGNASADKILSFYNRLDYGFAGGIEIHPIKKLLVGARYSISLSKLYKQPDPSSSGSSSSFNPGSDGANFKNNLVQVFIGYKF